LALPPCLSAGWWSVIGPNPSAPLDGLRHHDSGPDGSRSAGGRRGPYPVAVAEARAELADALDAFAESNLELREALAESEEAAAQVRDVERQRRDATTDLERRGRDEEAAARLTGAEVALPHLRKRVAALHAAVEVRREARTEALADARKVQNDAVRRFGPEAFEGVALPPELDRNRPPSSELARQRRVAEYERVRRDRPFVLRALGIEPGRL
jgi:hypothetical protein